jgi:hypothetical protein
MKQVIAVVMVTMGVICATLSSANTHTEVYKDTINLKKYIYSRINLNIKENKTLPP